MFHIRLILKKSQAPTLDFSEPTRYDESKLKAGNHA